MQRNKSARIRPRRPPPYQPIRGSPTATRKSDTTPWKTESRSPSPPASFGVAGILPLDGSVPAGVYPLIDSAGADFAAMGLGNWGQANAHSLGGGKTAWLTQVGSVLQAVVAGGGAPPAVPALDITRGEGQVTLTWTTTLTGVVAETATLLTGPWEALTAEPVRAGDTYTLTVPASGPRAFYRLRVP